MANSKNGGYGGGDSREVLSCSFCGKSEYEVPRLFSGVNCYICIDCIRTAYGIVAEEEKASKKRKMRNIKPKKLITPREIKDKLDDYIASQIKPLVRKLETGVFGADMKVSLVNDGPFTVILDSADI